MTDKFKKKYLTRFFFLKKGDKSNNKRTLFSHTRVKQNTTETTTKNYTQTKHDVQYHLLV